MQNTSASRIEPWPDDHDAQKALVAHAASLIRHGEVVAFPTDTVYGIAAYTWDPEAVKRLYAIKERPGHKAIALLLSGPDQLPMVTDYTGEEMERLARIFWPGGLTIVVPWREDVVRSGVASIPTVGVRVPDHVIPRAIIAEVGVPLATTSANLSGAPSAVTAQEVARQIGARVALIIDGGPCTGGLDSTVVDLTTSPPTVRRPGAVPLGGLEAVLGPLKTDGKI